MNSLKYLAGLSVLLILTTSCNGLLELQTSWGNSPASPDVKPTGYNASAQTGWMSYNDSTHLYFALSVFDPGMQSQILSSGVTIFMDTTGKMKEDCFVRFPVTKKESMPPMPGGQPNQPAPKPQNKRGGQGKNQRTSVDMMLEQANAFELQWQKGKEFQQINPSLEKSNFKTSVGMDTTNALNIIVGVPLDKIQYGGLSAINKLVVGIRFGKSFGWSGGGPRPNMQQGGQQAILGGSNAGTGGGGGGRGGRGGRGGGGNMSGGGMGSPDQMGPGGGPRGQQGPGNANIEYWYKTKLSKK